MSEPPRDELPTIQQAFPKLAGSMSGFLAEIEDLPGLDNKTKELVRLACTTILRNGVSVRYHAMLAAEFGATWEEVLATMVLTQPSFGFIPVREMLPHAVEGFRAGREAIGADAEEAFGDAGPPT